MAIFTFLLNADIHGLNLFSEKKIKIDLYEKSKNFQAMVFATSIKLIIHLIILLARELSVTKLFKHCLSKSRLLCMRTIYFYIFWPVRTSIPSSRNALCTSRSYCLILSMSLSSIRLRSASESISVCGTNRDILPSLHRKCSICWALVKIRK